MAGGCLRRKKNVLAKKMEPEVGIVKIFIALSRDNGITPMFREAKDCKLGLNAIVGLPKMYLCNGYIGASSFKELATFLIMRPIMEDYIQ